MRAQAAKVNVTQMWAEQERKGSAVKRSNPQPHFKLQLLFFQAQTLLLWGKLAALVCLFCFLWLLPQKVISYRYRGQWCSSSDTVSPGVTQTVKTPVCSQTIAQACDTLTSVQWVCTGAGCDNLNSCDVFTCSDISNWCLHNIKGLTKMRMRNLHLSPNLNSNAC